MLRYQFKARLFGFIGCLALGVSQAGATIYKGPARLWSSFFGYHYDRWQYNYPVVSVRYY